MSEIGIAVKVLSHHYFEIGNIGFQESFPQVYVYKGTFTMERRLKEEIGPVAIPFNFENLCSRTQAHKGTACKTLPRGGHNSMLHS